jgi:hypothetical protein
MTFLTSASDRLGTMRLRPAFAEPRQSAWMLLQFFCSHTTSLEGKIMKVIALSALALTTIAITSLAKAEPIKNRDVIPTLSTAQRVELSNAEMDRITAGTAWPIKGPRIPPMKSPPPIK